MGGLAFANTKTLSGQTPHIPRMPPEIYEMVLLECQTKLETLFDRVVVPRDAPAKKDYGDIDFLAGGIKPNASSHDTIWSDIKRILHAELQLGRGGSHSYGVPHPIIAGAYVQVDVEISPGDGTPDAAGLFEWTGFMKGDSDLLQIIGVSHRPLGITCNDQGLHIRVAQIEPYNKKKALLYLTRDREEAIRFYGLDSDKYREGFATELELFDWATSGRFFSPAIFSKRVEKSNDRSRQTKRPMYRRFVEEYMPDHMDVNESKVCSRNEVLEEALKMFDKHAQYEVMMAEHDAKEAEEQFWRDVREILPVEGSSLTFVLKALRRWVDFVHGEPHITCAALIDAQPVWTRSMAPDSRERLLQWVLQHWGEIKALEKARAATSKSAASGG